MKKKWPWIVALILALLVIWAIVYFIMDKNNQRQTADAVVDKISNLNELTTAEAYMKVVIEKENNEIFGQEIDLDIPGTKQKIILIIPGTVRVGVDLKGITKSDVKIDDSKKIIEITLPKAEISGEPSLDLEEVKLYSSVGLFREEVTIKEGFSLTKEAQKKMIEEAKEQGLLERANKNAEQAIEDLYSLVDYKAVVHFKEKKR